MLLRQSECLCLKLSVQFLLQCWVCHDSDPVEKSVVGSNIKIDSHSQSATNFSAEYSDKFVNTEITNELFMEATLAIIKPDAVAAGHAESIKDSIRRNGFLILMERTVRLTTSQARSLYLEHAERTFYNELVDFMSSGLSVTMVLARNDAVLKWRQLIGPTNAIKARKTQPRSLRATFGTDGQKNSVHGSDSRLGAQREINIIFPEGITSDDCVDKSTHCKSEKTNDIVQLLTSVCLQNSSLIWLADGMLTDLYFSDHWR